MSIVVKSTNMARLSFFPLSAPIPCKLHPVPEHPSLVCANVSAIIRWAFVQCDWPHNDRALPPAIARGQPNPFHGRKKAREPSRNFSRGELPPFIRLSLRHEIPKPRAAC